MAADQSGEGTQAEAAVRVAGWIAAAHGGAASQAAPDLLEGARRDAEGFLFARRLLEVIVDANDPFAAALGLRAVSQEMPESLPGRDRAAMRAGGLASLGLPWAVLPVARRWLRDRVSHLVLSSRLPADPQQAGRLSRLRGLLQKNAESGLQTLVAPGGDEVLGPRGAAREVERLTVLAMQPEVTRLAVDPARIVPVAATRAGAGAEWSLDADAERAVALLAPLLDAAAEHGTAIVLEPSDYRGALLAPEVAAAIASGAGGGNEARQESRSRLRLGVRLPAELPESRDAAERLILLSRDRISAGAPPLELTVGVSGLAGREQISSLLSGLAVPTLEGREAVSAQLLRLAGLLFSARAGDLPAVDTVVETEDPLLLAAVTLLAERHGVPPAALTVQLRAGTASVLAGSLIEHGFPVRMRLPVAPPREFAGAVGYLLRLAAEAAEPDSALARSAAFVEAVAQAVDDAGAASAAFAEGTVLASAEAESRRVLEIAGEPFPASHRTQLRGREWNPTERDSALFYRPPTDTERFDTGGLTAAVLGLGRDATGQIVLEAGGPTLRLPVVSESGFAGEPDTDASRLENRDWARGLLARAAASRRWSTGAGSDAAAEAPATSTGALPAGALSADHETALRTASAAADAWRSQRAAERAIRVGRLALGTASARDRLIEVLAAETGGPIAVLDAEVSGAVDAARYLGQLAAGLGAVRGAEFHPDRLALVVADSGVPLAERAEAMLAALAAGSAVLLAAHPDIARSSAALIEEWQAAGLPPGTAALAVGPALPDGPGAAGSNPHVELAAALAADPRVDRALVLGHRDTARALIRRRPELQVEGRFRALGSTLIAPSADPADAARDAVRSAFGVPAADARSARAVVLLGSAARSKRLRRHLADAVRGLTVGDSAGAATAHDPEAGPQGDPPSDPQGGSDPYGRDPLAFDLGPLPEAPGTAGLRALTELQPGEKWLVEPERLDAEGLLWRPGVRIGLRRDSRFWSDAVGMPVIGVIAAGSLDQAIALQNELGGGSVAGLHASDPAEILPWLDRVRAASLSVGRPTSAARIERQPGGGWGGSGMGSSPLSGGPNRLVALGSWHMREGTASSTLHLRGLDPQVQALVETAQASLDYAEFDRVRRAALADALTWRTSLGRVRDTIGLGIEHDLLRRWPVSTHVRLAESGSLAELVRVLAAAMLVGAPVTVSTGVVLPAEVSAFLAEQGVPVSLERDDDWLERIAIAGSGEGSVAGALAERVRLIGGDPVRAAEWLGGRDRVPLWAEPVTMAGPVELLAFLREQSISIAAHRHGFAAPPAGVDEWAAELDERVRSI